MPRHDSRQPKLRQRLLQGQPLQQRKVDAHVAIDGRAHGRLGIASLLVAALRGRLDCEMTLIADAHGPGAGRK